MKPLLIIAGAGQTGRELVNRLHPHWEVVVLDKDPAKLALLELEGAPAGVVRLEGDATSTLVLKQAGIESAHTALSVMGRDDADLEFCRLARQVFHVSRVMAMAVVRSRIPEFEELGVEVISRPRSVSSVLQSRVERGKRTTSDVGLGKGEILEVRVLPHSPAIGKVLKDLHPLSWLVGAIYRESRLVVPHGDTEIQAGDRVLLVGEPAILPAIADYFRSGTSDFPLQYGSHILVANPAGRPEGRSVEEALYLAQSSKALGVKLLVATQQDAGAYQELRDRARQDGTLAEVVTSPERVPPERLLKESDCGCLVLPPPRVGLRERMGLGGREILEALDQSRQPCLIARGTHPYRRILVAVAPGAGPSRAVELALDVSRVVGGSLTACTALPPALVAGEERLRGLREALRQAVAIGALYSMRVPTEVLEGNPVHQVLRKAEDCDLLILAHRKRRAFSLTRPDTSRHLLLRAPCSVLVLPYGKDDAGGG